MGQRAEWDIEHSGTLGKGEREGRLRQWEEKYRGQSGTEGKVKQKEEGHKRKSGADFTLEKREGWDRGQQSGT